MPEQQYYEQCEYHDDVTARSVNVLMSAPDLCNSSRITAGKIIFAGHISRLLGIDLVNAVVEYTDLYRKYTGGHNDSNEEFISACNEITWGDDYIDSIAYFIDMAQRSQIVPQLRGPHFRDDLILPNTHLRMEDNHGVSMHFDPTSSALPVRAGEEIPILFLRLMKYYPNIGNLVGASWIYSSKLTYIYLPKELIRYIYYANKTEYLKGGAFWSQFNQAGVTDESSRLDKFLKKVPKIRTMQDFLMAMPFWVSEINVPIDVVYRAFGLKA